MIFKYDDYMLRKPEIKDADGFIDICNDKDAMQYYGADGASIRTLDDAKNQIDWCINLFNENGGRWIIVEKDNDKYIGDIGFYNYSMLHKRAEIGYRLCRKFWGRGIITNMIKLLMPYGFKQLDYNRIEARVDSRNYGSKIVLLKNQFQLEGTMREYEFSNDQYVDLEIYSILKKEFLK